MNRQRQSIDPDLRRLLAIAEAQGAVVEPTHHGHYRITTPSGYVTFASGTPSDRRGLLNTRARLRRNGLRLP